VGDRVVREVPVPVATVPYMEDLAELAASVTGFAAREHLTIVPAIPGRGDAPAVCLGPDDLELPRFLELAARIGGGVLYLLAEQFDPDDGDDDPDELPAHRAAHRGQTGQVSLAFAANGIVHFWEHSTGWYEECQREYEEAMEAAGEVGDEERARLAGELTGQLLADPEFRAGLPGDRMRMAQLALPADLGWGIAHDVCAQAAEMAKTQYEQVAGQLDGLAAELLASEEYQRASSSAGRKEAAAQFLVSRADGFRPPALIRDELHARAQRLAKANRKSGTGLF
jgi:hypothetical protein